MANISTSDRPCKDNENAISQWKIDLVGTFFHKKQEKPAAHKQALVFEDCDISSICVHDDTTEISYDDHEGTLTSSPVPACETLNSSSSIGRAMPSFGAYTSESKLGKIKYQRKSHIDELSLTYIRTMLILLVQSWTLKIRGLDMR